MAAPATAEKALAAVRSRRQLDACLGLVLSHAAMLTPRDPATLMINFVDPLSTWAACSPAWWCRWVMDAWGYDSPLGDRLRPHELGTVVSFALRELGRLEPRLYHVLLRSFPT